jgi:hypothetical protein
MPWPTVQWMPAPPQQPSPRQVSTGLAVALATAILLLALAGTATIVLLVADGGSSPAPTVSSQTVAAPASTGE